MAASREVTMGSRLRIGPQDMREDREGKGVAGYAHGGPIETVEWSWVLRQLRGADGETQSPLALGGVQRAERTVASLIMDPARDRGTRARAKGAGPL